jgi:peptidylprolyl isomerase
LILVLCLALFAPGCGSDSSSSPSGVAESGSPKKQEQGEAAAEEETTAAAKEGEEAAKKKTKPKVSVPSGPAPKKLVVREIEEGSGPEAKPGKEVVVDYVGVNYETGEEFGTSWNRDPLTFELGQGLVIDGWEKGIAGMKPGGRRELIVPPDLGYGNHRTETIPPDSTLVFVVDLVSVK